MNSTNDSTNSLHPWLALPTGLSDAESSFIISVTHLSKYNTWSVKAFYKMTFM